jgi:MFS family permease
MMPLALFKSRTFSGINVVTFLLYAALGGALFFLPFNLVQLQGYSASEAGAAFLPFTIIMGGLSRWSGGLLDRFGARRPLIIGPAIAALGFALLAAPGAGGSYWSTFFVPLVILAFGMAVSVAPLTTAVMNAVPDREMGIASGINNAVARVAGLIAVALLGAVALGVYDRSLDRHSANLAIPPDAKKAVASLHGTLATALPPSSIASEERQQADSAVAASFLAGFRAAALLSAGLALAGTLSTALTIAPDRHQARRAS